MAIVKLLRRIHEAPIPVMSTRHVIEPIWPLEGKMHPNVCPSIRNANMLGLLIPALHELTFDGPDSFDVRLGLAGADDVFVVPGVIGSPDSTILFAKVDTGLSVDDLPVEWLSLPVLNLEFSLNLIVPGVIYPKGYCGPLFVAVAARTQVRVPAGYPLTQLVAIDGQEVEVEVSESLSFSRQDSKFQGLLRPGWRDAECHIKVVKARRCLELFMENPEGRLASLFQNEQ